LGKSFSPRQQRERDYYNQYALQRVGEVNFDPISGREQRPWNPYWHLFDLVKSHYRPGARLLDFGCGWGENTVKFARLGYDVEAFDISEVNVDLARTLAEKYGVSDKVKLQIGAAESLGYPNEYFDVIAGVDILHHVDIPRAVRQSHRVLKPRGVAIFHEPLSNIIFDGIRNTSFVKRFFPNDASFDLHITEDERKLTQNDLRSIKDVFPDCHIDRFRILSRIDSVVPSLGRAAQKLDYRLGLLPGMHWWSGTIVLTMTKSDR